MSSRPAKERHEHTVAVTRVFDAPHVRVFAGWAEREAKDKWFGGPSGQWRPLERQMEFRVGGRERARGQRTSGRVSDFQAQYHDIARLQQAYDQA